MITNKQYDDLVEITLLLLRNETFSLGVNLLCKEFDLKPLWVINDKKVNLYINEQKKF